MKSQSWQLKTEKDWEPVAAVILAARNPRQIVFLEGEMGAGKTTCVRFLMAALNFYHVTSPTYALHHEYPAPAQRVDHLDLYRLDSPAAWRSTGLEEIFLRSKGLVLIEWASQLPEQTWPADWAQQRLAIHLNPDGSRTVHLIQIN